MFARPIATAVPSVARRRAQSLALTVPSPERISAPSVSTEPPGVASSGTWDIGRIPIHPGGAQPIQRKLAIGHTDDPQEREADRVAEQVTRMPGPISTAHPAAAIRRSVSPASGSADVAPKLVEDTLREPGTPLDPASRRFMEERLGHDFSRVRIHADARAAISASAINARAYTFGSHVVFGAGAYAPGSDHGRRLLAHELTHVVQQGQAAPGSSPIQRDFLEQTPQPVRADEEGKRLPTYYMDKFTVFVPEPILAAIKAGGPLGYVEVHIFFSAGEVQGEFGNDILTHGLRGAGGASDWILIGVPSDRSINEKALKLLLQGVNVDQEVNKLRLTSHSRGGFNLVKSVGDGNLTIDDRLERVTLLDDDDNPSSGKDDNSPTVKPRSQVLVEKGVPAGKIFAYEVNVHKTQTAGVNYTSLPSDGMAAIGYVRLIQDAMVTQPDLSAKVAAKPGVATNLGRLKLPPLGDFTTKGVAGKVNLQKFCTDNKSAIDAILASQLGGDSGLLTFINDNDVARFNNPARSKTMKWDQALSAHHFFVAEIAHELTDI
jgi:Domain of unknown function (DUF4157)